MLGSTVSESPSQNNGWGKFGLRRDVFTVNTCEPNSGPMSAGVNTRSARNWTSWPPPGGDAAGALAGQGG